MTNEEKRIADAVKTARDFYDKGKGYNMGLSILKASQITGIPMDIIGKNLYHPTKNKKNVQSSPVQPAQRRGWMEEWEKDHEN